MNKMIILLTLTCATSLQAMSGPSAYRRRNMPAGATPADASATSMVNKPEHKDLQVEKKTDHATTQVTAVSSTTDSAAHLTSTNGVESVKARFLADAQNRMTVAGASAAPMASKPAPGGSELDRKATHAATQAMVTSLNIAANSPAGKALAEDKARFLDIVSKIIHLAGTDTPLMYVNNFLDLSTQCPMPVDEQCRMLFSTMYRQFGRAFARAGGKEAFLQKLASKNPSTSQQASIAQKEKPFAIEAFGKIIDWLLASKDSIEANKKSLVNLTHLLDECLLKCSVTGAESLLNVLGRGIGDTCLGMDVGYQYSSI